MMVQPQKDFNWIVFIILFCCTWIGWVFYLIYYVVKTKRCPMCNSTNWGVPMQNQQRTQARQARLLPPQPVIQTIQKYCPECGNGLSGAFCEICGTKVRDY